MNLYFLVEGSKTEPMVYGSWIQWLTDNKYVQVNGISELNSTQNSYYIVAGNGYPRMLGNLLERSIDDINNSGLISHFFVCLDADEESPQQRIVETLSEIENYRIAQNIQLNCQIHIIVQNVCIETWFLGNNLFCSFNSTNANYLKNISRYDVNILDPEQMPNNGSALNVQRFHQSYFKEVCRAKNLSYSKNNPSIVSTPDFLQGIINRINQTDHLNSFRYFHQVISNL